MDNMKLMEAIKKENAEEFLDSFSACANNFSFDREGTAEEFLSLKGKDKEFLDSVLKSCISALGNYPWTDGRNEYSACICRLLEGRKKADANEAGMKFLRIHPTLQQSMMDAMFRYIDSGDIPEYAAALKAVKEQYGDEWYAMPFI